MQTLKLLYKEFITTFSRGKFFYAIFCSLLVSLLAIVQPIFLSQIIKQVEDFLKNWVFDKDSFLFIIIVWLVFSIFYILFSFYQRFYVADVYALKNYKRVFSDKIWDLLKMDYWVYLWKKPWSIYKNFDRWTWSQFQSVFFFLKFFRKCFTIDFNSNFTFVYRCENDFNFIITLACYNNYLNIF